MQQGTQKALTRDREKHKLNVQGGRAVCPICGRQTKQRINPDTTVTDFPLYCSFCRNTTTVNREPEPEPESQSQSR